METQSTAVEAQPIQRQCVFCEAPFETRYGDKRRRFCSRECQYSDVLRAYRENWQAPSEFMCENCGKKVQPSFGDLRRRYCSAECCSQASRKKAEARRDEAAQGWRQPKRCDQCEQEFIPKHRCQHFCSEKCRVRFQSLRACERSAHQSREQWQDPGELTCQVCGAKFHPSYGDRRRYYCSSLCYRKANTQQETEKKRAIGFGNIRCSYTYTCRNCGKVYHPKKKDRNSYCSRECCFEYKRKKQPAASTPIWPRRCAVCEEYFIARRRNTLYCSDECHWASVIEKRKATHRILEDEPEEWTCNNCGQTFQTKYGDKHRRFCSQKCCRSYNKKLLRGQVERPDLAFDWYARRCRLLLARIQAE